MRLSPMMVLQEMPSVRRENVMKKMENVSIEMDTALFEEMEEVCRELGMDVEAAFTLFAREMCLEGRIPFDVEEDAED